MKTKIKKKKGAKQKVAPNSVIGKAFSGASIQLGTLAEKNMLEYGTYTIMQRAIPMLYEGVKPVQRRIIYTMFEQGLFSTAAHRKSAKVVGDTMGKYHPHGDLAIYGAMVSLSTGDGMPFALVDGQGNWGNFDGSAAAAMRYTEARLTKYATQIMVPRGYMDKEVIPYIDNYDGSEQEPLYLPSLLPTLFLMGAEGIATGVSVTMPAYTYESVMEATRVLIKTGSGKKASRKLVPTQRWGAKLLSDQATLDAYHATGKGSLLWTAEYTVSHNRDTTVFDLSSIPPTSEIGWKSLSESLLGIKNGKIVKKGLAYSVVDVSDGTMHIQVTTRDDANVAKIKKTLQRTQSCNSAVTILSDKKDENGIPMVEFKPWAPNQILEEWLKWRVALEERYVKSLIRDNDAEIARLTLMVHAAKHLDQLFEILKAKGGDKIAMIEKKLKVSNEDAKAIWQLAIGRLDRLNVDTVTAQLAALAKTNKSLKADLKVPLDRISKAIAALPVFDSGTNKAVQAKGGKKKKGKASEDDYEVSD